jgi:predicted Zn-dependent protease
MLATALAVAGWSWLIRVPAIETAVAPQPPAVDSAPPPETKTMVASIAPWAALGPAPDVQLPASMTLEIRGSRDRDDEFLRAFGDAITPYRAGRYADAARALDGLTASYADVPEAWFYLGASRLYADDPSGAAIALRRALTSTEVGDQARWLEAVALERDGRHERAAQILDEICRQPGPNRARACDTRATIAGR